jgi:16S rRNA (guanine966-N2)-methyltransferase
VRIIAGSLKGRRLKTPAWEGLRPTSDKLRETLFNVLAGSVEGARVLDGYAGTGALGIEALSRGAAHVTFVEADRRAAALVAENLRICRIGEGYAIIRDSLDAALRRLPQEAKFDIILLAPPYDRVDMARVTAASGDYLAPGGLCVIEHARRNQTPQVSGPLIRVRVIMSGDSALAMYRRHEDLR